MTEPRQSTDADAEVARLIVDVRDHQPRDDREQQSRMVILDQLVVLPYPFDRHAALTHVTASAVVVGRRGVLLHRHRRLQRWLQPGGHLEPGESPMEGARRESEEETGLALDHPTGGPVLLHLDVHEAADAHMHLDIRFLLLGPDEDPAPPPDESQEVAWFSWNKARALSDEALAGALQSARRLIDTGTVEVPWGTSEETDG
ncbi:MAG: NUDIX domain-containing protein [Acidimicrobiales bacterium]